MKKLILLMAVVALLFSCSKDNVTSETETTADLTQMTPSKSLAQSSDGVYVGVFGHHSNQDLHGKILINANNDGNYSAQIDLLNGEQLTFKGSQLNQGNIHFSGKRGSFDFNALDFTAPEVKNVFIDNEDEAYMVVQKETTRGGGWIIFGTYDETGNEANFFGNYDMLGNGIIEPGSCVGSGPFQYINLTVISHNGLNNPKIDSNPEVSLTNCGTNISCEPFALIEDTDFDGMGDSVYAYTQTENFNGATATWNLFYYFGDYADTDCGFGAVSGNWSWNGKTGPVFVTPPPPSPITNTVNRTNTNRGLFQN